MNLQSLPEQFGDVPTPQQRKSQWWQRLLGSVIMISCMVLLLPLVLRAPRPDFFVPSTAVLILSTFLLFPLALFVSVTWHELGHLLAGWLVGFRFVFVTFGPLRIAREAGGLRMSLINTNLVQWQGRALLVPTEFGDFRRQRMVILAGGPVATLLQLLLIVGLNFALRAQAIGYGWGLLLLWLLLSAVMLLPATAVPQKIGNIHTDMARILQLWRGGAALQQQLALTNLVEASLRGVPPAAMDATFLATTLAAPPDSSQALVGHYVAHEQALDRGDVAEAAVFLDKTLALLQNQPPGQRSAVIFASAAYLVARYERDLGKAQAWLQLIKPEQYNALALEVEQILLRVRAQLLLLAGELALAKTAVLQSKRLLQQSVDLGAVPFETRLLDEIWAAAGEVAPVDKLPPALQPTLMQKRPFVAASARGFVRWALIVVVGLLLGFGWRQLFPGRAVDAYQQGVDYLDAGQFEEAIAAFDRAIALDEQFAQAVWARGEAWLALGELETAVADFDRVIEMHPTTFPSIYLYRASAYTQMGDYPAAIADYEMLLSLNPDEDLRQLALESIHILQTAK
ncbi:MAG: tetratricopeptide repeat protein [Ardenticatenaceae bacterium]|nr:tetratricopeptide repeat protein [Anaerolineales bacterium]MCB8941911.1 tetratricopeptide repeat protein [Ardenticatenaceae bacterium]MCB8973025.1 tetratricopeptide repeat protein [Ardenticatenaceae bacterium]